MAHFATLSRRGLLTGMAGLLVTPPVLAATALPTIIVNRDPSCGCCGGWIDHLRQAGFVVRVVETTDLQPVRARLGVPDDLAACHTGEVSGYVIEGHVPAAAIKRLLAELPTATGLAVPGMPVGSPGMEVEGFEPATFEVILFGPSKQTVFGRYRGHEEV